MSLTTLDDFDRWQAGYAMLGKPWVTQAVTDLMWEACRALTERGFVQDKLVNDAEVTFEPPLAGLAAGYHLVDPAQHQRILLRAVALADVTEGRLGHTTVVLEVRGDAVAEEGQEDTVANRPVLATVPVLETPVMPLVEGRPTNENDYVAHVRRALEKVTDENMECLGLALADATEMALRQ